MKNTVRFITSIHQVGQQQWSALLSTVNPFLRFEFLAALEDCLCIDSLAANTGQSKRLNSGWIPCYALLEDKTQILAIAPVFKKLHSYGEYVFDWAWAEAYQQHELKYYPKLVWAIPFTPSSGPRIICKGTDEQIALYYQQISQGLTDYCQRSDLSGWHCLFPDSLGNEILTRKALSVSSENIDSHQTAMSRTSCQFHWFNQNFSSFSHYLEKFTSRKRKNIKKERLKLIESGFSFIQKTANQITPTDITIFYRCYQLTYAKRNMRGYLSLEFFLNILEKMPDQLLLVQGHYLHSNKNKQQDKVVANALFFKDEDNLYGRYWGCLEEYDSLHFECCYYQGIEYCIEHNLSHFDPGTQGEHKISRGFEPTICYSQHWIAHPQFAHAIDDFLKQERLDIQSYAEKSAKLLPFNQAHFQSSSS